MVATWDWSTKPAVVMLLVWADAATTGGGALAPSPARSRGAPSRPPSTARCSPCTSHTANAWANTAATPVAMTFTESEPY
jgi:hypothetical protein